MKKLNTKGFTHHVVMFGILALVLGAMGFAGYRVWQNKNIDAEAAYWRKVESYTDFPLRKGQVNGNFKLAPETGKYRFCISATPIKDSLVDQAAGMPTATLSDSVSLASGRIEVRNSAFTGNLSLKKDRNGISCTAEKFLAKGKLVRTIYTPTVSVMVWSVQLQLLK